MNITSTRETKKVTQQRIRVRTRTANATVLVAPDGWYHDSYDMPGARVSPSDGLNVRLSMNGPLRLTYEQWRELVAAVEAGWESVQDSGAAAAAAAAAQTTAARNQLADHAGLDQSFGLSDF